MDPQTEWGTEMAPKGTDRAGDGPGNADGPKEHRQSRGHGWTQRAQTEPGMDPKGTDRTGDGPGDMDGPKGHTQSRGRTRRHTQGRGRSGGRGRPRGRSSAAAAAPRRAVRGTAAQRPPRRPHPGAAPPPARTPPPTPPTAPHRYGARSRPRRPEVPCSGAEPPLAEPSGIGRRSSAGAVGRQRTRRQNVHRSRLWPSEPPPGAGPWECREESSPLRLFLHTGHVSCCGRSGG